ncbi:MAG: MBL fold metallo-hydrolase [Thermoanaerobacteraceae bacterium]|nr:MBL fold metallo-hydrolase [Thermoanaerobacteraceae bacterium]
MKLLQDIYLVGSGEIGLSNRYDCHVYLVDGGNDAVLIDCGVGIDNDRIIANIKEHVDFEKVSRVLITHTHADHSGGAFDFQKLGKKVLVSRPEAEMLAHNKDGIEEAFRLAKNAEAYPEDYEYIFFKPDGIIEDREKIKVGKYEITPILLKGHSPGLLCYFLKTAEKNVLFTSDQVFINGAIGLLNCPGSELNEYRKDIGKLADLQVDAIFPGHRLFVISNGQEHIDKAIESLSKVFVPTTF